MSDAKKLTDNQRRVLDCLSAAKRALTAYEILDQVREEGMRAPAQVYRALEKLIANGRVHRLESLNAFFSCAHDHGDKDARHVPANAPAFAICERCGTVEEYDLPTEVAALKAFLCENGFTAGQINIEIRGCCAACVD